jgi:translation initiation factor IF-1
VLRFLQNKKFEVILMAILHFSAITNGALLPSKPLTLQESYLVRCLTYISRSYFAPGRSVVISSPSEYRDVQQELIAEIQQTNIWPVVVTLNGNFSKNAEKFFIDGDGSYIILTQNENVWNILNELHPLTKNRETKFRISLNFEAKFVVAGTNEFSLEQMQLISIFFRSVRMYNFIILSQEHYEINNELGSTINVNNVETDMKFGAYTWFPYQSSDSCDSVHNITLLDILVISEQGYFTKNTDLFPVKIRKSFNGCHMISYVIEGHWELTTNYVHDDSNGNVGSYIKSLEYQLLGIVLQKMNMTFFHVQTPKGFEGRYENITQFISGRMRMGFIDIAVGDVGSHYLFKSGLDSTNSYSIMSIRWYVPCSVAYPRWSSIF